MKREKRVYLGIAVLGIVIISLSLVSAGWFSDLLKFGSDDKNLEGELPNANFDTKVIIKDDTPPQIVFVSDVKGEIAAPANNPKLRSKPGGDTPLNFTFLAQQGGPQPGNLEIVPGLAPTTGYFNKSGEAQRNIISCYILGVVSFGAGTAVNYSCKVNMSYYDAPGIWSINVTIQDNNNQKGSNSTKTFTVQTTSSASTSANAYLNWTGLKSTNTNIPSDNNLSILNEGNVAYASVSMNGTNLTGQGAHPEQFILVNRFKGDVGAGCAGGNALENNQIVSFGTFSVPRSTTGTDSKKDLPFCIIDFAGSGILSNQEYKSIRQWEIIFPIS
ncbi:MAG: hypothetical protein WC438_01995 [Candidatus Pacearchaeota archaeon]